MNLEEFADLSAGYALGALSPADRDAFEAALADHPEWSDIVKADAAATAALADSVTPVAPPLTMRGTLLSQLSTTPQHAGRESTAPPVAPPTDVAAHIDPAPMAPAPIVPPLPPLPRDVVLVETQPLETVDDVQIITDAEQPPLETSASAEPAPNTAMIQAVSRRNWTRGLFGLAASLVLLVTLGFGAASLGQWLSRPAAVIALEEIESAPDAVSASAEVTGGGTATAHWSESLGKAVIVTDGLPSLATDQTFEMWFVRADGTPVSAGLFATASAAPTTTIMDGALEDGDTIAITVEQAGGSTTGAPTTEPIVAIPTA